MVAKAQPVAARRLQVVALAPALAAVVALAGRLHRLWLLYRL